MNISRFPFYPQLDSSDCGAACIRMIAKHYGKDVNQHVLRETAATKREGASLFGISLAAENIGFRTVGAKISFETLKEDVLLPAVVFWNQIHFVVVYKITSKFVYVADPAAGLLKYKHESFLRCWISSLSNEVDSGIVLAIEPRPEFYEGGKQSLATKSPWKQSLYEMMSFLKPHKSLLILLVVGLFFGSLLQLTLPFLTQSIVDVGISSKSISFVNLVLLGQLVLFIGIISNSLLQQIITLHLGTRVNISSISHFLWKLFKLPISFFEGRVVGDILKRIEDNYRIEQFLSVSLLSTVFSILTFTVFSIVLLIYNPSIFIVFSVFCLVYASYVILFLKKRRELDYKRFQQISVNHGNIVEIVHGMNEIKLNNGEASKMWEWEKVQAKIFKVNVASMKLSQYQNSGGQLINEVKNVIITAITAASVISGEMTLGIMLSIQFIIGQISAHMNLFVGFIQEFQDAKIALERIHEVSVLQQKSPEEEGTQIIPEGAAEICLENVSFRYNINSEDVLSDINLTLPKGKVTAIVGHSGSGKTTLLKLMLRFYAPTNGSIRVGELDFNSIEPSSWRAACGVVMQDGYIFTDTIARNIAVGEEVIDEDKLHTASKLACIDELIESLPLDYNSILGVNGSGFSQGQKQRLLIARALYKNPSFIMFDEATSSLDAKTEKKIIHNTREIFKGRTVMVIAHRLSTIRDADQIVVLEKGKIAEKGTHEELIASQGVYYDLIQNQLSV
ncbi:MAG: peptidase domain-containing ABC transporter [Cyclobacteriaceae bacterium]